MKHYKIKRFANEAKRNKVSDSMLIDCLYEFLDIPEHGHNQYSLGSGLYKLRLASKTGRGKSAGSRIVLALKKDKMVIWLHLYDKNDKGNVSHTDLMDLKTLSKSLLNATQTQIQRLIDNGKLLEVRLH